MISQKVNELFVVSKNNPAALEELTDILTSYGISLAKHLFYKFGVYNLTIDDLEDYILFIVNMIYNSYIPGKKSFSDFVKFIMYKRLTSRIIDLCNELGLQTYSLDEAYDETNCLYEIIEDKNCCSIPDLISLDEFNYKMSSPEAKDSLIDLKKKKVFSLESKGYSGKEIMKLLNLTEGQYRYLKSLIQQDIDLLKIKMELK